VETFVHDGDLYLLRPGAADLVVRGPDAVDLALVAALGERAWTTGELVGAGVAADAAALDAKLASLLDAGLLIARTGAAPPLAGEDAERFSRQLPYLAELGDEAELQRRLRAATVTVIGCGGVGTWAIAALAAAGVGRLVLVDDDVVNLSNLNRQVLYRRADVGSAKVAAAAAWVRGFDPAIDVAEVRRRVTGQDVAADVVGGADAIVLAADWPPYELGRWVNAACAAAGVPFITAGQIPPLLRVGPTYAPGRAACFACHEAALREASSAYDAYVASRRDAPETASTLGPASALIGGLVGLELMHLLVGETPATEGAALVVDIRTLVVTREAVPRRPGCPACDDLPHGGAGS
jgi:bacteriocin biosynthesis cyclodehydratase domain-containing protein